MKIHLNQLSLGEKVDSEIGELEVTSNFAEGRKIYLELTKVPGEPEELIKE